MRCGQRWYTTAFFGSEARAVEDRGLRTRGVPCQSHVRGLSKDGIKCGPRGADRRFEAELFSQRNVVLRHGVIVRVVQALT